MLSIRASTRPYSLNTYGQPATFEPNEMLKYTFIMLFNLPLKEMTLREKLAAMELLWEDLARTAEAVESPAWHKQVLDGRRQRDNQWGQTRLTLI